MDVGTLKNLQADTIRILVWVLSFLTFGYATGEFEVTAERLGVYRPEEHIEYDLYQPRLGFLGANVSVLVTQKIMPTTRMRASSISAFEAQFVKSSLISTRIQA